MSGRKIVDMPMDEWRGLAGLSDPYAIVSAEVGVPAVVTVHTDGVLVESEQEKDLFDVLAQGYEEGLSYDELFQVYLECNGISSEDFNSLLDEAVASGDQELMDELLAAEDEFQEVFGVLAKGAAMAGRGLAKGASAVGKGAARLGKAAVTGAQKALPAIKKAAGAVKDVAGKGASKVGQGIKTAAGEVAEA